MRILTASIAFAALATTPAFAQEAGGDDGGLRGIGIGVIVQTQPYLENDDTRVNVIPSLAYDKGRIWISGKQLGLILTDPDSDGPWELSALLDYRFQGYNADESPVFEGMEDRDGTLEAGAVLTYDMGAARILTQGRVDVLDGHGGFDLLAQAEYDWMPAQYTQIKPYIGISFRSEDHVDYYYGVREDEALVINNFAGGVDTFDRQAYAPGETVNPFIGIVARQALSRHLVVGIFAQHDFFPTEITDSPIIDPDVDGQTTVGIQFGKPFLN